MPKSKRVSAEIQTRTPQNGAKKSRSQGGGRGGGGGGGHARKGEGRSLDDKIERAITGDTRAGNQLRTRTWLELRSRGRGEGSRKTSTPGIRARANNRIRTGQDVPSVTKGKLDKPRLLNRVQARNDHKQARAIAAREAAHKKRSGQRPKKRR